MELVTHGYINSTLIINYVMPFRHLKNCDYLKETIKTLIKVAKWLAFISSIPTDLLWVL